MHFIAGAIEKAGVDEHQPARDLGNARGQIGRGTAFLVHQADLDRVPVKPQQILDRIEQIVGKGGFVGPVHLGLDDIDRARLPAV